MNGIHDLGGMHGFGPVVREENEPVFHADWEGTVYAISQVLRGTFGVFNLDEFRHGIERMAPVHYLEASYYERWLASIETNLIEKGVLSKAELDARIRLLQNNPETTFPRRDNPALAERVLEARPRNGIRPAGDGPAPRFAVGDAVVARNINPVGHTRLPRYVRGKRGVVDQVRGIQVFPDANAHGLGEQPQTVYSVRFTGRELWGEAADPRQRLYIDLWESYLEAQ
jgi:nitrile hydratase beta subunit